MSIINLIKKPVSIILLAILVAVIGSYLYFSRGSRDAFATVIVERGDIIQEVNVTGNVNPAQSVDLAFEKAGKVSKTYVSVGDKVVSNQILVQLISSELYAQLVGAQANLKTEEAELDELKRGTREEEIKISQTKVDNAEVALNEAKNVLVGKLQSAYTVSDDAIHNKADSFFKVPPIPAPQLNFSVSNSQLRVDIESQRLILENMLKSWKVSLSQLTISSNLNDYISDAKTNLNSVSAFLDDANLALNGVSAGASVSQTTLDAWKSNVSTARTNITTSINDVIAAEKSLKTAQSDLFLAQQELNLELAGSTEEDIKAQEAQVEKAKADVLNYEAQLSKTILRSPINGLITKQEAKVGEIVSANEIIVSVISANQFQVESNVPEADIAKLKINDEAKITLDAYGDSVVFNARVITIDPAETIIEGVATYKTTFQFDNEDVRIKSGMTANIDILTDKRENVLVIPQRAVITRGAEKFVLVDNGTENPEERKIETGLRGSDGNVEVVSGLSEGEKVAAVGNQ